MAPLGRSDEPLLHLEVVFDEGLDNLVDAGVGGEAERLDVAPVDRSRPGGDDALDQRDGLPSGSS